jgi:hypothetical protein
VSVQLIEHVYESNSTPSTFPLFFLASAICDRVGYVQLRVIADGVQLVASAERDGAVQLGAPAERDGDVQLVLPVDVSRRVAAFR